MSRKLYNNETTTEQNVRARNVARGTFVRKTNKDGSAQGKVYIMGEYCRDTGKYELVDTDDVNRCVYVNVGAMLFIGFTY